MIASNPSPVEADLGDLLRYWRSVRRKSQLALASEAATTARYLSFIETGRARPSPQMVMRLARALDVPHRERNALLLAAGFSPTYSAEPLDSAQLAIIEAALGAMLGQHEPFPAIVMDRGWNVLRANRGAQLLFQHLLEPEPIPEIANVLRLMIAPGPVRGRVLNPEEVATALLRRAHREAVGGVLDPETAALIRELRALPDVAVLEGGAAEDRSDRSRGVPVLDVRFLVDGAEVGFFSVVSTVGTPIDVTAQELRFEAFFPADEATRASWERIAGSMSRSTAGRDGKMNTKTR